MLDEMFEKTFEEILNKIIITQKSEYKREFLHTTISIKLKWQKVELEGMLEKILEEMLEQLNEVNIEDTI